MSARDTYHYTIKNALELDGWTITDDPLRIKWGIKDMYVDLGAEKFLGAEKDKHKIAVEVKSFTSPSTIRDLQQAMGQFILYQEVLSETEPDRILYLGIREETFQEVFQEPIGMLLLDKQPLRLCVVDEDAEVISRWIT